MNKPTRHLKAIALALCIIYTVAVVALSTADDASFLPIIVNESGGVVTPTPTSTPRPIGGDGETVAQVRNRGVLKCGGNASLVGFGFLDPNTNEYAGFDIDFCKAIAAAIFGDGGAGRAEIRATTGSDRFAVLQSAEIDVLIRNTTLTIDRDSRFGFNFEPVTFYDGQGFMVRSDSGIESLEDLNDTRICVQAGTVTQSNLAKIFSNLNIEYVEITGFDAQSTFSRYFGGSCDAVTEDKTALMARLSATNPSEEHFILDRVISKQPLGPIWRHGDNNWGDIIRWTIYCTIEAEELGVNSVNVDDMLGNGDPAIRSLLGNFDDFGQALNLNRDFCYQIIKQVGNYSEIYERNLGVNSEIGLSRGLNKQWYEGGLLYSLPFR